MTQLLKTNWKSIKTSKSWGWPQLGDALHSILNGPQDGGVKSWPSYNRSFLQKYSQLSPKCNKELEIRLNYIYMWSFSPLHDWSIIACCRYSIPKEHWRTVIKIYLMRSVHFGKRHPRTELETLSLPLVMVDKLLWAAQATMDLFPEDVKNWWAMLDLRYSQISGINNLEAKGVQRATT